jgi:hypothetical protein
MGEPWFDDWGDWYNGALWMLKTNIVFIIFLIFTFVHNVIVNFIAFPSLYAIYMQIEHKHSYSLD